MIKIQPNNWDVANEAPEYAKEDATVGPAKGFLTRAAKYTAGETEEARLDALSMLQEYGDEEQEGLDNEVVDVEEAYELLEIEHNQVSSMDDITEADLEDEKKELGQALESFEEVYNDVSDRGLKTKVSGMR